MMDVIAGLKLLGPARLIAMSAVGIAILALMVLLMLRGGKERMALLYSDLDMREAAQIGELLDRQHIAHQIGAGGTELLVPDSLVSQARLLLARDGLPSGGGIGYEIFDRGDGLVASQFQQTINQTRALEGELSRTIRGIQGVRSARVHLVLPRREPFASAQTEAQASVLLTLTGVGRIDHEGVQAILTLVAAAVPGLRPQSIAVIDSHGNLLARAGQYAGADGQAAGLDDLRHATELRLSHAVEEMLEPSLGSGHVRAEAAVDLDFDQVRETNEKFDPEGQVVRGSQNVTSSSRNTEAGSSTSVQNNLPNAEANTGGTSGQEQKQEETTNYEIGKTVRTLVRDHPQIRRISLAVMVDGLEGKDDRGQRTWRPRSTEEIDQITTLVKGAIGFDAKRGDRVDVVTMRFAADDTADTAGPSWPVQLEKADILRLSETALLGLLGLLALLLVLRPLVLRITSLSGVNATQALDAAAAGTGAGMLTEGNARLLLEHASSGSGRSDQPGTAVAVAGEAIVGSGSHMVSISNVEGQMRASSIRSVIDLVEKHPDESLAILRAWMHQEAA